MNFWIFVVTGHKSEGETLSADEIYNQRIEDQFFGITKTTPNRRNLEKGDKVVFYVGLPKIVFAGTAVLDSSCFKLTQEQQEKYGHGKQFYAPEYGVLLKEIDKWGKPKSVKDLVSKLNFIENQDYWYSYLQGGVRQITEDDFRTICDEREVGFVEQIEKTPDLESPVEFALETHLEEFIYNNWNSIDWGSSLELFKTEEQNGRQFPAGIWSIDFLARDRRKGDIVVIELKKGKTSDAVIGQLLRYIAWVKENLAERHQEVRGIIVANEVSEKLRYGVKNLDNVEIKTYKVNFKLIPFRQ